MAYFYVWGCGKQARITRLHCSCQAICASSWSTISNSGGGQACRSAVYRRGRALGGHSRNREYVNTHSILSENRVTRVQHRLPCCWHPWAFHVGCDPARGVACQEGHTVRILSVDTYTTIRNAARDNLDYYTLGTLHLMLEKPVSNNRSCHLHKHRCNAQLQIWDIVFRIEDGVPADVLHSAPLSLFAAVHSAASEECCGS